MEILWSPWRSKYISTFKEEKNNINSCFLCEAVNSNEFNFENLLVYRSKLSIILLNRYPYNSGHLLIAPTIHTGDFINLSEEYLFDIMINVQKSVKVLNEIYKCHGFNIGANLGRAAGAGVPDHIHYHVIPRWNGDINFISAISDTKVISESLEDSHTIIKETFQKYELTNWKK